MRIKNLILKFILASIILAITAYYAIDFDYNYVWALVATGFLISFFDFALSIGIGVHETFIGRILVAAIVSTICIYSLEFLVESFFISFTIAMISVSIYSVLSSMLSFKLSKNNI